ncbi:MAG: putative Ig domain-containing protein, partial [Verrucomicrobiae bacterium]|nr:putative Ig domain-containing protein [Verrucomicrobiae bacterium]
VNGVNDTPVAVGTISDQDDNDSDSVSVDMSGYFADPDAGATLTYTASGLPPGLSIDLDTGIISGTLDSSASAGGPYLVQVTAEDENGASLTRSFTWNVSNPGPVAGDDDFDTVLESGVVVVGNAVVSNDSDPDGDTLTASLPVGMGTPHDFNGTIKDAVAGSQGGHFAIDANGDVTFDPGTDFDDLKGGESRQTTFSYLLSDTDGATTTATVTLTVTSTNLPPEADSGKITVSVGSRGGRLGLEAPSDPDGDPLTIQVSRLPKVGTLRLPNGKPVVLGQFLTSRQLERLVYDAPANYRSRKPVIFRYLVSDGREIAEAKVRIKIVKTCQVSWGAKGNGGMMSLPQSFKKHSKA